MAPRTPAATDAKRKRVPITIGQRQALRKHHAKFPALKQAELAAWFQRQYGHCPTQGSILP
ncbi:hypothetical protein E4U40_005103, partial [Claviceps sp. LM458 group G5]